MLKARRYFSYTRRDRGFRNNSSDLIEGRKKVVGSVHGLRHLLSQI